jgi:hypothetical protein
MIWTSTNLVIQIVTGILGAHFVTASGSLNEVDAADNAVLQGLTGLAAGGCLMLVVGFIKHSIEKHKAEKDQPEKN